MSERRVAIITGASSGIGQALAERAVRAGWDVFAVGRRAERLTELAALVAGATGRIAILALDIRTPRAPTRIVREALERFGRIDVLVNNAGGVAVGPIAEQSDGALYEQMETHVIVPLALTVSAIGLGTALSWIRWRSWRASGPRSARAARSPAATRPRSTTGRPRCC